MSRFSAHLASLISSVSRKTGPLGLPIDKLVSPHYFFNKAQTKIRYCSNGKWGAWESSLMEVHLRTFQVLAPHLAKDHEHIYYKAQKIDSLSVDIPSFRSFCQKGFEYLALDDSYVYSFRNPEEPCIIAGANPMSYYPFSRSWARDDSHYFFNEQVARVDYKSFRILSPYFAADEYQAYYYSDKQFQPFKVHIRTLDKLCRHYIFDRHHIYFFDKEKESLTTISYSPTELVLALDEQYIRVGQHIYCNGKPILDADPLSFRALKDAYAKDAKQVYWMGLKLGHADPQTFHYNEAHKRFEDNTYLYETDKAYPKTAF